MNFAFIKQIKVSKIVQKILKFNQMSLEGSEGSFLKFYEMLTANCNFCIFRVTYIGSVDKLKQPKIIQNIQGYWKRFYLDCETV
jgi:hypothetical protein